MTTLHENYQAVKDGQIRRWVARLSDGQATVTIKRPTLAQLSMASNKAVEQFKLHLIAVHSE